MLLNDVIIGLVIVLAVVVLANILFLVLTRIPDAPPDDTFILIKLVRPFAFLIAQLFILSCACGLPLMLYLEAPGNAFAARYPELATENVKAYMKAPAGPEVYILVFLFVVGSPAAIWMLFTMTRRINAKTWDEPGDFISRLMRALTILLSRFGSLVGGLILLAIVLFVATLFRTKIAAGIAALPHAVRLVQANEFMVTDERELAVAGLITLVLTLLYALFFIVETFRRLGTLSWYATEGTIEKSRIRTIVSTSSKGSRTSYEFNTRFNYEVDNEPHFSEKVMIGSMPRTYAEAWLMLKQFPVNARVPVYYNPRRPEKAVLIRGLQLSRFLTSVVWIGTILFTGCLMIFIGLAA